MEPQAPPPDRRRVAVIGAGIVGMCCAQYLQRDGHDVVVFDPDPPGAGCSFGNAGGITTSAVVPVGMPGVMRGLPRMLSDPLSPLTIRWSHLPRLVPWLWRFVLASTPARAEAISLALKDLLADTIAAYLPLARRAGAEAMIQHRGLLYVYETEAAYREARPGHDLRRRRGVRVEELNADELRQLEPCLAPSLRRGVFMPDCAHTINPARLVELLAADLLAHGGAIKREKVAGFEDFSGDGPRRVVTTAGAHQVDAVVVAAGAHSKPLAAALGCHVPLDTERGYHAMIARPGVDVRVPMLAGEGKFAITPMEHGLRLAGTVELAALDAPPNYDRARILIDQAKRMFPGLRADDVTLWMGRRPSMPDSLPVIGRSPRWASAFFAFGHGHLGLTFGAITGRLIADMVARRPPPFDLTPFRPDRFASTRRVGQPPLRARS